MWIYIFIGVGIRSVIHNWLPVRWNNATLGQDNWLSVPVATAIGIPMYADIFGSLPITGALVAKRIVVETVLTFMTAVTALSLPSLIIMLKKVIKPTLLALFFAIVAIDIMPIGYLLNMSWLFP